MSQTWTATKPCGCSIAAISADAFPSYQRDRLAKFIGLMMSIEGVNLNLSDTSPVMYAKPCPHEARQISLLTSDPLVSTDGVTWYRNGEHLDYGNVATYRSLGQEDPAFEETARNRHAALARAAKARRDQQAALEIEQYSKHPKTADNGHGNDPEKAAAAKARKAADFAHPEATP